MTDTQSTPYLTALVPGVFGDDYTSGRYMILAALADIIDDETLTRCMTNLSRFTKNGEPSQPRKRVLLCSDPTLGPLSLGFQQQVMVNGEWETIIYGGVCFHPNGGEEINEKALMGEWSLNT